MKNLFRYFKDQSSSADYFAELLQNAEKQEEAPTFSADTESKLQKKYNMFMDPGYTVVQNTVFNAWSYINQLLHSKQFAETPSNQGDASLYKNRSIAFNKILTVFGEDKLFNYYKEYSDYCEVKIPLLPIDFFISLNSSINTEGFNISKSIIDRCERTVQAIIPNFKLNDKWKILNVNNQRIPVLDIQDVKSDSLDLEDIEKIRPNVDFNDVWDGDKQFNINPIYSKFFSKFVRVEFEIKSEDTKVISYNLDKSMDSGWTKNLYGLLKLQLIMHCYMRFPMEYAYWSTTTENVSDYIPKLFFEQVVKNGWLYAAGTSKIKPLERITGPAFIKKHVEEKIVRDKITIVPRTNNEAHCITQNGNICWVPYIDDVSTYNQDMKSVYDSNNNRFLSESKFGFKNQILYTDWVHDRLLYVNTNGNIERINLRGCVPLDEITINQLLDISLNSKDVELFTVSDFFRQLSNVQERGSPIKSKFNSIMSAYTFLSDEKHGLNLRCFDKHYDFKEVEDKYVNDCREAATVIRDYCISIYNSFYKISAIPVSQKIGGFKLGLDIIIKYSQAQSVYSQVYKKAVEVNTVKEHSYDELFNTKITVPNAPGLQDFGALPHQADILLNVEEKKPRFMILSVDAGGGKSLILTLDILKLLEKNLIKRPAIVVPGNLVKEFCNEIRKYCKDTINILPITLSTLRRINMLFKDEQAILTYFKNLPVNTILVINYDVLKHDYNVLTGKNEPQLLYLNERVAQYPVVNLLKRLNIDFIASDESQNVKNPDSERSEAFSMLVTNIQNRRIASGTLISDSPVDLVNEMATFNPAILVNKKFYIDKFASETSVNRKGGTKVLSWKTDTGAEIRRRIKPYAQYHVKKSSDWSYLLPEPIENFFEVDSLVGAQNTFYQGLMEKAIEDLRSDPKIARMIEENNPEDQKKIEQALKRSLSQVEIFINAPDSNPAFKLTVSDIRELVSPKVKLIDQLIDAHFNGGTVQGKSFKPDTKSILILCYNRAVSKHIYKYTENKSICLHYTAGDVDVLNEFRKPDSRYRVLIADEDSITTGLNLQVASHLIRVQSIWSPGPFEQSLRRILRPDVLDEYNRDQIKFSWLLIGNTIEVPKTARLMSKIIEKAKVDNEHISSFRSILPKLNSEKLKIISMKLDNLLEKSHLSDYEDYFNAYSSLREWDKQEHTNKTEELRKYFEQKYQMSISSSQVKKLAKVAVKSNNILTGSRKVYTPFAEGAIIPDYKGIKMTPVSIIENEDDEKGGTEIDLVNIKVGDICITELGIGKIKSIFKQKLKVAVSGFGEVTLPKSIIGVPLRHKGKKKLISEYKKLGSRGDSLLNAQNANIEPTFDPEDPEIENTEESNMQKPTIDLQLSIINGFPSLWIVPEKEEIMSQLIGIGFKSIDPYLKARIKKPVGASALEAALKEKGLQIEDPESINELSDKVFTKQLLNVVKTLQFTNRLRNFFRITLHRKVVDPKIVRMYPMVIDDMLFVAMNKNNHRSSVVNIVKNLNLEGAGITRFRDSPMRAVYFFPNAEAGRAMLRKLKVMFDFPNYIDLKNQIRNIKYRSEK